MAIIDLKIALSMVDYGKNDNVTFGKYLEAKHCEYIFFPATGLNYVKKFSRLTTAQCLERLRVLYNIWTRSN